MREFQEYTQDRRAARRRRWLWSLPAGLVAALLLVGIGMRVGAGPISLDPMGYQGDVRGEASPDRRGEDPGGWVRRILGGSPTVSDGPLNVLVLGVDENPDSGGGGDEVADSGTRTDTIMLVQVTPGTGEVKLLSMPRDLLVEVEPGVEDKVNAAYSYGGIEQAMWAVEGYTGVPIRHYATVDFEGFEEVIDAMGGVEVDVEAEEFPDHWRLGDGIERLDGRHALMYARYRGTAGGDLDRIQRQQELVAALRSEALGWDTATELPAILGAMDRNVETDLGLGQAVLLGRAMIREGRGEARMTSTQLEGTPKTLADGSEVLVPDDAANKVKLRDFRY